MQPLAMARSDLVDGGDMVQPALETAARHASMDVPVGDPSASVRSVRRALESRRFESAAAVAVCENDRLVGVVRIEELLAVPGDRLLEDVMDADPPVVAPGTDQEVAAWCAVTRGESSLAVVDESRRFLGFIPPQRLLAILLEEHDEDVARIGGFLTATSRAQYALQEPVLRRFWHRVPWLLAGLIGMALSAHLVATFEVQLQQHVILAFFVPGVVYLADAVGTQTETLFVRGLSVGMPMGRVVLRELITGWLVAIALALAFFPLALWWWDRLDIALAVSLALLVACSIASAVAMAIPALLNRWGWDPALGSGPLATVIQDLLSIAVYLSLAMRLVA
jgi:magnesium transporter